jgi:hypothetical protein
MNKTAKGIIALTAVLALLGGGYAVLRTTEPKEGEESISSSSEVSDSKQSVMIVSDDIPADGEESAPDRGYDVGVIKAVTVKNKDGELHVIEKTRQSEDSAATYTLEGYDDVTMKDTMIGTLANSINELSSIDVIEENCTDLAKFGLASPLMEVEVEYESGKKVKLLVGNEAPADDATYVMVEGSNTVYTVSTSTFSNYDKTDIDFVDTTVLESPEEMPVVNSLRIQREDMDYDIYLEYDKKSDDSKLSGGTSATHVMVEPTSAYLAVEKATDITTGMFGLSAEEVYCVHCGDSDIAEAGLKEPFCTVTMKCADGNDHVLLMSEPFTDSEHGKCCYAMLEGGNVIYTVSTDTAKWAVIQPVDIASKIFIASYVWNISDLKLSAGSESGEFKLTKKTDEDKDSYTSDDFSATYKDKAISSERFRKFYSFLISANAENFALGENVPDSEPMASVEYTDSYNKETVKLDFYDYSSMTALITVNGESKFFITKSYVDTLIKNIKSIESEDEFITTWS